MPYRLRRPCGHRPTAALTTGERVRRVFRIEPTWRLKPLANDNARPARLALMLAKWGTLAVLAGLAAIWLAG